MQSDQEFLEQVRERQLAQIERMDAAKRVYWRAPLVIAVLAWALLLLVTFLTAVGVVALWSGAHVYSSAVFLLIGMMAGAMSVERPGTRPTRRPSPLPSSRGRGSKQ